MTKTNLPVILLRGVVLLPNNDVKLEFEKGDSSIIIDEAEMFHHGNLLVICDTNVTDEINYKKLPKIGIIAHLNHKIELPNGRIRVVFSGLSRASVDMYLNANQKDDVLEAIITKLDDKSVELKEEKVLVEKVKKEVSTYVKKISYLSNSILSAIKDIDSLSKITDIVAMSLSVDLSRLIDYLNCLDPKERLNMLLSDIYEEEEKYNIEISDDPNEIFTSLAKKFNYFEKDGDIYKIYKFREFYAFSKIYGTEDTIHYRYRKNDFPLEKYGTYGVHVDSDIPFTSDKYSIYMFRNDYAPFKYAFQYDCLTHLVKSELGKELLENGAKEDLLRILYNRIAYAVDESLMPEYD